MPLFKVTKSLKYNQIIYESNTIHEFKNMDEISDLIDTGVLIPITDQQKKDFEDLSLKLDGVSLEKIQKDTRSPSEVPKDTITPNESTTKALCSKCEMRVDVIPNETFFYRQPKGITFMKQVTCIKCGNKITMKASAEEKSKIESGLINLTSPKE